MTVRVNVNEVNQQKSLNKVRGDPAVRLALQEMYTLEVVRIVYSVGHQVADDSLLTLHDYSFHRDLLRRHALKCIFHIYFIE